MSDFVGEIYNGFTVAEPYGMNIKKAGFIIFDSKMLYTMVLVGILVLVMNMLVNPNNEMGIKKFNFFKLFFWSIVVLMFISWTNIYCAPMYYLNPIIAVIVAAFCLAIFDRI